MPGILRKIPLRKVFVAAVVYTLIATFIHQIETILTIQFYLMPEYQLVWSRLMMPAEGPPPILFNVTSAVFTFVTGFMLAGLFAFLKPLFPKSRLKQVLWFTDIIIGMLFVFMFLPMFLLINIPYFLLVSWYVTQIVITVTASFFFVKILGK